MGPTGADFVVTGEAVTALARCVVIKGETIEGLRCAGILNALSGQ